MVLTAGFVRWVLGLFIGVLSVKGVSNGDTVSLRT
jgi:hypothetical protein